MSRNILDIPNQRSSHSVPTPRGGGIGFVLVTTGVVSYLFMNNQQYTWLIGLLGAGSLTAAIGFFDDRGHIAARWRLLAHFVAAVWGMYWIGGLPPIELFGTTMDLGLLGHCFAAICVVWMLNLYNFMDGIDGIAGVEAVTVCLGGVVLITVSGGGGDSLIMLVSLVLAGAVAGFLLLNFPPAKIFMGDAGSGFLGLSLSIIAFQSSHYSSSLFWAWFILLGVFIVDATFTLLRRVKAGSKPYEAHRTHGYQYAARHFCSHRIVTLSVLSINVFWLFPCALLVVLGVLDGGVGVLVAYFPLIWLALRFNAGKIEYVNS